MKSNNSLANLRADTAKFNDKVLADDSGNDALKLCYESGKGFQGLVLKDSNDNDLG